MSKKEELNVGEMVSWCWRIVKRRLAPGCPLFEEGDLFCQLAAKYLPLDTKDVIIHRPLHLPCGVTGCPQMFDCLKTYECHYNTCHRNMCSQCRRVFPSAHLLDIHILESHDVMFELLTQKQHMYQCLVESCKEKFPDGQSRRNHMIKVHKYPANYRFDKKRKPARSTKSGTQSCGNVAMETGTQSGGNVTMETGTKFCVNVAMDSVTKSSGNVSMETETLSPSLMDSSGPIPPGSMDKTGSPASSRVFSYKVPKEICFGSGSSRGFASRKRGRGGSRSKHWHNQGQGKADTTVDIEAVEMADLAEALD